MTFTNIAAQASPDEDLVKGKGDSYIFGVIPAFSSEKLVTTFEPLVDYIAGEAGITLRFETAPSFKEFVQRTHYARRYDFLFTAPHLYYMAREQAGYHVFAKVDGEPFRAVIVVRKDSLIHTAEQLRGKQIATMNGLALVTVLGRASLREVGVDPNTELGFLTTPSHDASLQALLRRKADAALLPNPFLSRGLHPEIRSKLRVVLESQEVPHVPISAAPWVPGAVVRRVQSVLLKMSGTAEGAMVLRRVGYLGFIESDPAHYDVMAPYMTDIEQ